MGRPRKIIEEEPEQDIESEDDSDGEDVDTIKLAGKIMSDKIVSKEDKKKQLMEEMNKIQKRLDDIEEAELQKNLVKVIPEKIRELEIKMDSIAKLEFKVSELEKNFKILLEK